MARVDQQDRILHEIAHGRTLADGVPEEAWGWGTPAGRLRAARRADMLADRTGLAPGVRALEVGCGTGLFTAQVARHGCRIVALDISRDLLGHARRRGLGSEQVTWIAGRVEDGPFAAGSFDVVYGSSVLHHLDLDAALPALFRCLRPGGRLAFTEPNMLNPQIVLERKVRVIGERLHVSPDETAFVRWPLARRLRDAGFVGVRLRPFDWLHPATPPPLIPLVRGLGWLLERAPLVREFSGSLVISARRPGGA